MNGEISIDDELKRALDRLSEIEPAERDATLANRGCPCSGCCERRESYRKGIIDLMDRINEYIKVGDLSGDALAQRNGMILARNLSIDLLSAVEVMGLKEGRRIAGLGERQ